MDTGRLILGIADYAAITVMLVISSAIGIFFKLKGGPQQTEEDFLMAGKNMPVLPVALSLMATFLSATTLMGIPAEMYLYGTHMAFMNIGFATGSIATAYIFLPLYFSGQVSTTYEYLEKRFGKISRSFCSLAFIVQTILLMAVSLYAPALALSAVTNLSMWTSVISIGAICTFYCSLGGMKAVLWTDVFQACLMYLGVIAIIVTGCLELGGFQNIINLAIEGERLVPPNIAFNYDSRYTLWNVLLQGFVITFYSTGCGQIQVQRLLTVKNIKRSRTALFLSVPMIVAFHLLTCVCGLIIYVKFRQCDPMTSPNAPIHSPDQLLPYYIITALNTTPGLPGLCICCIFSASLSTISSSINSLTSATVEDFIKPMRGGKALGTLWAPSVSALYGLLCVGLAFLVSRIGHLVQTVLVLFGLLAGPMLGAFLLAAFTTTANEMGTLIGLVFSLALGGWLSFGLGPKAVQTLAVDVSGCILGDVMRIESYSNLSSIRLSSSSVAQSNDEEALAFSYMWITPIVLVSTFTVGFFSSLVIGCLLGEKLDVSPNYLCPARRWFVSKNFGFQIAENVPPNPLEKLSMELHQTQM